MLEQLSIKWLTDQSRFRGLHTSVCLVCASILLTITSYGIVASVLGHINVVGETLVDVEVPSPQVFPLYAKPISFLMVAALGFTYSGFELVKPTMRGFTKTQVSFLKLIAFVGLVLAAYEVLYNFAIWTAEISTASLLGALNPDVLLNQFPNPKTPWNLVFATKLSVTVFAAALYSFFVIRNFEKSRHEE
jgi:hypothetical protein